jgi:probable phosphoglycerate mutase
VSTRRVLLLRHGQTAYNAETRFQGQTDVPLNQIGLSQAQASADRLAPLLAGEPVTVVSSDLRRALQTAEPLAERLGIPVIPEARLREVFAGQWEGLLRDEIVAQWPDEFTAWHRGENVRLGGGETHSEAGARAAEAIVDAEKAMNDGTLVCVGHGAALRAAVFQLIGATGWPWNALEGLRNAHWAELQLTGRGWRLSSYNVS